MFLRITLNKCVAFLYDTDDLLRPLRAHYLVALDELHDVYVDLLT